MILRRNFYLLASLLLLLLLQTHVQGKPQEDYSGGGDGASSLHANNNNDDIYDPAQQQAEVDMEMQQQERNSLEQSSNSPGPHWINSFQSMEDEESNTAMAVTEALAALAATTTEQDENTAAEIIEDASTQHSRKQPEFKPSNKHHSQEPYYDEMHDEDQLKVQPKEEAAITTSVPEYVRKAKAERFPKPDRSSSSASNSDYIEEDAFMEQQTQAAKHEPQSVPQSASDKHARNDSEYHDDEPAQPQQPQAHVQQLPAHKRNKLFKATTDDYYYDDTVEDGSMEPHSTTTTTTTSTTSTTTTTTTPPPATTTTESNLTPVLQSRFGGFAGWPIMKPSSTTAPPVFTITTTTSTTTLPITTTTTAPSPRKQSKHIHLAKPELLPADQLRNYIKDVYIRMPLAVIVDPSAASLDQAKRLYIDALQDKNINIKIVLVTLNASGVPSAFSFNNTREFIAGLNSTKVHEGGDAFVGVLQAAELVPYDSAIFISTAAIPPHTDMVQDAAITLLKKRIRLFMLWYGDRLASENETEEAVGGILGEVAIRSGGEIIHIVSTEHGQHIAGNTLTLISDAYQGAQELDLPVDTTLSSLHVRIDDTMRRATLATPNGDINLKKLVKFKLSNDTRNANNDELDAYVPLNKLRKSAIYKLQLTPEEPKATYNVFIRAERKADVFLGDIIKRIDSYYWRGQQQNERQLTSLTPRLAKLKFPESKEKQDEENDIEATAMLPKSEVETFSETELVQPTTNLNQTQFAAATGQPQRASLNAMLLQRCGTKIELHTQSQLLVNAGQMATLLYEVTNMRNERVYQTVQVTDERRYLVQLNPQSFYLRPRETRTVRLTAMAPANTSPGTTDRITLTSYGPETATLALNLRVVSSIDAQDITGPTLSWEFGNRCDYLANDLHSCADRFWTLDITAQDWQSGIMRLQTSPPEGLFYRNYYTAGTTEPLKATYMASCCEPKVAITAYDAAGNQRSINIDVRDIVLTEAAIAAICLGAILLLLLIVVIIWSIIWCCRRRKVTLDMPTYLSHSTRSME